MKHGMFGPNYISCNIKTITFLEERAPMCEETLSLLRDDDPDLISVGAQWGRFKTLLNMALRGHIGENM